MVRLHLRIFIVGLAALSFVAFSFGCSNGERTAKFDSVPEQTTAVPKVDSPELNNPNEQVEPDSTDDGTDDATDELLEVPELQPVTALPQISGSRPPRTVSLPPTINEPSRMEYSGQATIKNQQRGNPNRSSGFGGVRSMPKSSAQTMRVEPELISESQPIEIAPEFQEYSAAEDDASAFEPIEDFSAEAVAEEAVAEEAVAEEAFPAEMALEEMPSHLEQLPAGATHSDQDGFATVQVFYATDRSRAEPDEAGERHAWLMNLAIVLFPLGLIGLFFKRPKTGVLFMIAAAGCLIYPFTIPQEFAPMKLTYNGERGELVRGICKVTVPDSHQRGQVERPSLLRFEIKEDRKKHIVLNAIEELNPDNYYDRMRSIVQTSPDSDLLVFIHGYNVDFDSAVRRTAQLSVDLPFRGVPVCYSWPSQASLAGYPVDENNVAWTVFHLKQFLMELVNESQATSINIVAHSMGNRAMTAALSQLSTEVDRAQFPLFDRVVLAAPDVDADLFRRELAPRLATVGHNVTLYASSDDEALKVSKQLHGGYPRAGESGPSLVITPYIETVDVSGIDLSLLGHSYYGDNQSILRDLFGIVRQRMSASERPTVTAQYRADQAYFILR